LIIRWETLRSSKEKRTYFFRIAPKKEAKIDMMRVKIIKLIIITLKIAIMVQFYKTKS